jgi:FSR family fosmidomycin resistance protein-like MFS transporter
MSRFRSTVLFLASGHFLIHVYTQVIPALLPTIRTELGISLVEASVLITLPSLVNVGAFIPAGILSDKYGPKIMSLCFVLTGISVAIIAFSKNYILLALGSILLGLGSTFYHPPSLKTATILDPNRINLAMSFHLAGGSTGIALGPISIGLLMPFIGWRRALLLWIPFQLILAYVSLGFTNHDGKKQEKRESILSGFKTILTPTFLLVIAASGFIELTMVNLSSFITTYFNTGLGISESLSSIIYGLGPLAGIIGTFSGGELGNRVGNYKALLMTLIVIALLLGLMPITNVVLTTVIVYILYRSLVSASMPLMNNMVAVNSDEEHRSLAFSVFFMVANIGAAMMPLITSYLAEKNGITVIFPVSVVLLIPPIIIIYYLAKRTPKI